MFYLICFKMIMGVLNGEMNYKVLNFMNNELKRVNYEFCIKIILLFN